MKYAFEEAMKKAVARNREVKGIISRIMDWDTEMTAVELAKYLRISKVNVYKFACRYHLNYGKFGHRHKTNIMRKRQELVEQMLKETMTTREIAKVLGVKPQYISQIRKS